MNKNLEAMREKLMKIIYENEYDKHIGLEFMELTPEYGKARLAYRKELLNPYGGFHGGALLSFADTVAGTTACMNGYFVQTISSNMNFLLGAKDTKYIYCECRRLRCGKHIAVYDIRITDDRGTLLDSGEYSYFLSDQSVI